MNVRFFSGSKKQYLNIAKHNPLALYFCHDTRELFWGDKLLSDGIRVIPTKEHLPELDAAAEGIIYYIAGNRNGYVLSADRSEWLQVIYAPTADISAVPEGDAQNTAVSVAALREIENTIYEKIASIDNLNKIKTISFAGVALDRADGVFSIDRATARKALGIAFTEGCSDSDIEIVATKEYVDDQIAAIPEVDLSNYAERSELAGLATEEFVKKAIVEAELGDKEVDLSAYYTKSEVDDLIPDTSNFVTKDEIPSVEGLASEEFVNTAISNIAIPSVDGLASKEELTAVESKIPSIDGLATEDYVNTVIEQIPTVDFINYYTKEEVNELIPDDAITSLQLEEAINNIEHPVPDLTGYATETFVINKIAEAELNDKEVDLTGYATKDDIKDLATISYVDEKVAAIEIPEIPTKVTELENDAGYLTEHQDLSAYAKKSDIPTDYLTSIPDEYITESELADELAKIEHPKVDLAGYATEEYVDNAVTGIKVPDTSGFIKMEDVEAKGYITEVPAEFITEDELDAKGFITEHQSLDGYATEQYVNDSIAAIEIPEQDLTEYAKLTDIPDVSKFITEVPAEFVTEEELAAKGYLTEHQSLNGFATEEFVNQQISAIPEVDLSGYAKVEDLPDTSAFITAIPAEYITESELEAKGYLTAHQDISGKADKEHKHSYDELTAKPEIPSIAGLATEQYVNDAVAGIDIPEVDVSKFVSTETFSDALATKANEIPFVTDKFVTSPIGSFTAGESVKGLTIAQILAKLLGLSDESGNPDEPEMPDNPQGIVDTLIANEMAMYAVDANADFVKLPFNYKLMTEAEAAEICTDPCFYQIKDADGTIIESGYQEIQANSDAIYYIIALPKEIDYESMVTLKVWDENMSVWTDADKFEMTTDTDAVAALCDEVGVDISQVDQTAYTIYVWEDLPSGSLLRYVINE